MENEPILKRGRLPRGYSLVPKGNVYITGNCRKQTQAAGQTVYVVVNGKDKQIGIAVPTEVYQDVEKKEVETRTARAANVDRRDNSIKNGFEQAILMEFPRIPREDLSKVLDKALEKRAGKVGRTGQLSDRKKAQLAVRAHIRHSHTLYDNLLRGADKKGVKAKNLARKAVQSQVDELAASWAHGRSGQPTSVSKASAKPSSSASSPPARSSGLRDSRKPPISVRAKLARIGQWAATTTRLDSLVLQGGLSLPSQPLETRKQTKIEIIDLTMDDDDKEEEEESSDPFARLRSQESSTSTTLDNSHTAKRTHSPYMR